MLTLKFVFNFSNAEAATILDKTEGAVKSLQVLDIQGDGRDDLMLVNWDSQNPFRFRLQNAAGRLGPEVHFTLPPIRDIRNIRVASRSRSRPTTYQRPCQETMPHGSSVRVVDSE